MLYRTGWPSIRRARALISRVHGCKERGFRRCLGMNDGQVRRRGSQRLTRLRCNAWPCKPSEGLDSRDLNHARRNGQEG